MQRRERKTRQCLSVHHHSDPSLVEIGVDEAGRGCLAGPVVAAAVIWPSDEPITVSGQSEAEHAEYMKDLAMIQDSKKLSVKQRERARDFIKKHATAWAVAEVPASGIDAINILKASFRAMHLAIDSLLSSHDKKGNRMMIMVDGDKFVPYICKENDDEDEENTFIPHMCVVNGDSTLVSIAAASILAKTHRDDWVRTVLHPAYPVYGFDKHVGYGTAKHLAAIKAHGPCPEHRRSFRWDGMGGKHRAAFAGAATATSTATSTAAAALMTNMLDDEDDGSLPSLPSLPFLPS